FVHDFAKDARPFGAELAGGVGGRFRFRAAVADDLGKLRQRFLDLQTTQRLDRRNAQVAVAFAEDRQQRLDQGALANRTDGATDLDRRLTQWRRAVAGADELNQLVKRAVGHRRPRLWLALDSLVV